MRAAWAALLLAIPAASPAREPDALDGHCLMRVVPGARRFLHKDGDGCPAPAARCRSGAYLVPGDVVVASGAPTGGFVPVAFTDARGRETTGHLPAAALRPMPTPAARPADWRGVWVAGEREIGIAAAGPGRLRIDGRATWGMRDPERVRRGGVHTGEFAAEVAARPGGMAFADGDGLRLGPGSAGGGCRVRLRLLGPYLLASDDGGCGGVNVSFDGPYRRRTDRGR